MAIQHILLLASWYPNAFTPYNGDFIQRMAETMSLKYKVTVLHFCAHPTVSNQNIEINNRNPHLSEWRVYTPKNRIHKWKFLLAGERIVKQIEKERGKIDLCHVQVVWKMGFLALWLKLKHRIPYHITEHWTGYLPENYQLNRMMLFGSQIIGNHAASFSCVSLHLAHRIRALKIHGTLPSVLPNIVVMNQNLTIQVADMQTNKQFIHVSNFRNEQKNTLGILRAFEYALASDTELSLLLIGGNPSADMTTIIEKYPQHIRVMSEIPHIEVLKYIAESRCLISFSQYETFAITCAEALCYGTPVIYTACGGPEEYIDQDAGWEVEKGDERGLASLILRVASMPNIDRQKIGENARTRFSTATWLAQLNKIYFG